MANGPRKPMRQGQQNRRGRGRGRKPQNPLSRNYESNGPDVKIRGSASHIAEKYAALAHDALSSGNMVAGESYLQHAEHYNRIIMANQAQQADGLNGSGAERTRSDNPAEESNGIQPESGKQPEEAPTSSPAAQVSEQADDQTNNDEGVLRTLSRATKSNGSATANADKAKKKVDKDVEEVPEESDAGETPDEAVT